MSSKNGQKPDFFVDNFKQHFKYITSHTDLRKCMTFKVAKQINAIGAMKSFTKPDCNICMEERLNTQKKNR